nr:MAG TPA: hypothetical protein [Caudoviricetes sp.]
MGGGGASPGDDARHKLLASGGYSLQKAIFLCCFSSALFASGRIGCPDKR